MIPTCTQPYRDGELRTGWASWDDGQFASRSIKYAYRDKSGKISRGCPELPFDILVDMMMFAAAQGELRSLFRQPATAKDLTTSTADDLREELRRVNIALMILQHLGLEFPSIEWSPIYNHLGDRLESVKSELGKRGLPV